MGHVRALPMALSFFFSGCGVVDAAIRGSSVWRGSTLSIFAVLSLLENMRLR